MYIDFWLISFLGRVPTVILVRDAYPQFADVWVPPGYHIEFFSVFRSLFLQLLRGI